MYAPDEPVTRGDLATLLYRFVDGEVATGASHPFIDVSRPYQQLPVSWSYANGLTTGSPAGSATFKADNRVTRAEMVTFMWRLAGSPAVSFSTRFFDVAAKGNSYFARGAIAWAYETSLTTGSPAGARSFGPD